MEGSVEVGPRIPGIAQNVFFGGGKGEGALRPTLALISSFKLRVTAGSSLVFGLELFGTPYKALLKGPKIGTHGHVSFTNRT